MRSFLLKSIAFLVFLGGVNFCIHFAFLAILHQNSIVQKKETEFFNEAENHIDILFLGDSHVNSVQEHLIPTALKFDSFGESYIQSYYKLKYLIADMDITIDNLILPFDLHSFSSFRSDRIINDIYWSKYVNYFELAEIKKNRKYIIKWTIANFCAYVGKGDEILEYLQKVRGFPSLRKKQNENVSSRISYHLKNRDTIDQDILFYFKKILHLCSENNINIVFVKYPVSKQYLVNSSHYINKKQYYNFLISVIEDFSLLSYAIWDFQDLYIDFPEIFIDSDHLNSRGSTEFTKILATKIEDSL